MFGKVRYVDFNTHDLSNADRTAFNAFLPMMHKRTYFSFEQELRCVIWGGHGQEIIRRVPGWLIPLDLHKLIVAVHVAPDTEAWIREAVAACVQAFGLDPAIVVQSSIDQLPAA
jgi:hypothetical protein